MLNFANSPPEENMRTALLSLILVGCLHSPAAGQQKSVDEASIDKVKLTTSLQAFLKLHPTAVKEKTEHDEFGVVRYVTPATNGIQSSFDYLGDELLIMTLGYAPDAVGKAGGSVAILKELTAKHGRVNDRLSGNDYNKNNTRFVFESQVTGNRVDCVVYDPGRNESVAITVSSKAVFGKLKEIRVKRGLSRLDD